jgi:hypothetical protein
VNGSANFQQKRFVYVYSAYSACYMEFGQKGYPLPGCRPQASPNDEKSESIHCKVGCVLAKSHMKSAFSNPVSMCVSGMFMCIADDPDPMKTGGFGAGYDVGSSAGEREGRYECTW